MSKLLIAILFILSANICESRSIPRGSRQNATTTTPVQRSDGQTNTDTCPDSMPSRAIINLPTNLTRQDAKFLCETVAGLLSVPKKRPGSRNRARMEQEAKCLARILTGEASLGSTSSNSSQSSPLKKPKLDDAEYCDEPFLTLDKQAFTMKTMEAIVDMHNRGYSERTIQGKYRRYRRQYLESFKDCLSRGGGERSKRKDIDEHVLEQVREAREQGKPVHDGMIIIWARRRAAAIGANSFSGSNSWLTGFKDRNKLGSRKITKTDTSIDRRLQSETAAKREAFLDHFRLLRSNFRSRLILNVDQTGFNYELSDKRTISFKGERDTRVSKDSSSKTSHSYTVQPTITRDGRLMGKLLLCLQEVGDKFGPRVADRVHELEREYGNIRVVASRSGKMTSALMMEWYLEVLKPAIEQYLASADESTSSQSNTTIVDPLDDIFNDPDDLECQRATFEGNSRLACAEPALPAPNEPLAGPSWIENPITKEQRDQMRADRCLAQQLDIADKECIKTPEVLLLADSWSGQSNENINSLLRRGGIKLLRIPERTTGQIQPLDVGFFLQYKRLIKKISMQAMYEDILPTVTSRDGIINLHSLAWDQFNSPVYFDMIRYAWHNTDRDFSTDELDLGENPALVDEVQFNLEGTEMCEHVNCTNHAFIQCSYCGKLLCLHHFLERSCFHSNMGTTNSTPNVFEDPQFDSDNDELK